MYVTFPRSDFMHVLSYLYNSAYPSSHSSTGSMESITSQMSPLSNRNTDNTRSVTKSKKTIKVILNSITRIRLIVYIEDPKEALSIDYIYMEKDTKAKKTIKADIKTISCLIRSNTVSIIN